MSVATKDPAIEYQPAAWELAELLPPDDPEALLAGLEQLEEAVAAFEAWRPRLEAGIDRDQLLAALRQYEQLLESMTVLSSYVSLRFSSDTQSQEALTDQDRVNQALAAASNRVLFFSLWWKGLPDEEAEALLPAASDHPDYLHYLTSWRRLTPYTLDERTEQIITIKDADGIDALLTLYSVLTNRLEFSIEVDGETKVLTRDGLMSYAYAPRREVREAAYRELLDVFGREATPLAQIYAARVRDWSNEQVKLRGFSSPIAVRNVANDLPDEAVEALLATTRRHAPLFQRFFRLKAGWLGLPKLRRYDIYAPLADSDREIPYDQAVRKVLETFEAFHPTFAAQARRVFTDNHIDSEVRRGKRGGAFCATVLPRQTPWVLVNYTGKPRDVLTVAHELGHAIHSMMAEQHSVLTQRSSLPLAETASVFAEILMTERLLADERDPLARRELLLSSIDNIYATVLRQAYFVLFEVAAHQAILEGKPPAELNRIYFELLAEQFGDSVEVGDEFRHEWLSIPHIFHTPFYCYAYCFGQLLVLALYRRYQQEGDAFKPSYLKMLAYGGAARPEKVLAEAGVDASDEAFWSGGFEVIEEMIDHLEATFEEAPPESAG